jgi:hypothetical protein
MSLCKSIIRRIQAQCPTENDPMAFARAIESYVIEECAQRAEAYAYMSPNFTALAEELREMKEKQ